VLEEVNTNKDTAAATAKPELPDDPKETDLSFKLSLNMLVIKHDSTWKGGFDFVMLVVSC
jgi:hypothetical protein